MNKITFEGEIITPMFMYGADGETPELRPSEFKGMLRFWWRALHPNLGLEDLRKKEGEIFGDTSKKSSFGIKTKILSQIIDKNENLKNNNIGLNYLFYSMFLGKNKDKYHFKTNTKFEISFIFYKENYIKDILNAFWLLTYLGGIGSRNRRGAGNYRIIGIEDENNLIKNTNLNFSINNENGFINILEKILPVKNSIKTYINLGNFSLYKYRNIFDSWENALNEVGNDLQNFRKKEDPDYTTVKNFILNGNIGEVLRPAFGLPLQFRYRSLEKQLGKGKNKNTAKLEGSNKERQRSGSPLFIKILRFDDGYIPILVFFRKELLLNEDKIKISSKNQKRSKFLNVPDDSIIERFLQDLINKGKLEEVRLNES